MKLLPILAVLLASATSNVTSAHAIDVFEEGVSCSKQGIGCGDDVERTVWIYNPLRVLEGQPFVFKQYETAHPYSTWSAELNGNPCQEIFFGMALETRLPEHMRDLAKIVRLEKSDEFKHCLEENPDEHQMCRDVAEEKLKTKERRP